MNKDNSREGGNRRPDHSGLPRIMLFILTVLCVSSMGYSYLRRQNAASVSRVSELIVTPFQKGVNQIGRWITDRSDDSRSLASANAKIRSLEAENESLSDQIAAYDRSVREYQDARDALALADSYSKYDTVGANVIFRDAATNWYSTFTIDKGSADGMETGMNVIADGGLVGYLSTVNEHTSIVTTIINDDVNVSGMQPSTGDTCIVEGDLTRMKEDGLLRISYMKKDFSIDEDAQIVTSSISDRYLPNIVIGYATEVSENPDHLTSSGYLKPAVDFEHLNIVLVITTQKDVSD